MTAVGDMWDATEAAEAVLPRFPLPDTGRWRPLRSGVVGIYKYDDQTFVWHRGKLLIRGLNGTGKSVVPEVQVPYVLEANVSAERISTFGGKDRSMHWKVIGHDETGRTNGRSYTWIEYGRLSEDGTAEYFTIGSGLSASKGSRDSLQHWHFHTSQRIGLDLTLIRNREPLSEKALAAEIGIDGGVYSRSDIPVFRSKVNGMLYGMTDEQYRHMNNMIHELRKPKLSDKLDLDKLSQLLSDALPTVSDTTITPLADGFERLDRHAKDLTKLEEMAQAAGDLARLYRIYARRITRKRAADVRMTASAFDDVRRRCNRAQARLKALGMETTDVQTKLEELEADHAALSGSRDGLTQRPVYTQGQEIQPAEERAQTLREHADRMHGQLSRTEGQRDAAQAKLAAAQARLQATSDAESIARAHAAAAAGKVAAATAHTAAVTRVAVILDADTPAAQDVRAVRKDLMNDLHTRRAALGQVKIATAEAADAVRQLDDAQAETEKTAQALLDAEVALEEATAALETAREEFGQAVVAWAAALTELAVDTRELDITEPGAVGEAVGAAVTAAHIELASLRTAAEEAKGQHERELARLRAEYEARVSHPLPARPTPARRVTARVGRGGATMYELLQFAHGAESAALEAACEAIELLDAWVTPDGRITSGDLDLFVTTAGTPPVGRNLGAAVVVDPEAAQVTGIDSTIITAALARVELTDTAAAATHEFAVGLDGTWRVGPMLGATAKDGIELIGAAARERTRQKQLAELAEKIAGDEAEVTRLAGELTVIDARAITIDDEKCSLPPSSVVTEAGKKVTIRSEGRRQATEQLTDRRKAETRAGVRARKKEDELRLLLDAHSLIDWRSRLPEYEEALGEWQNAFSDWLATVGEQISALDQAGERLAAHTELELQAADAAGDYRNADLEALRAESRYDSLLDTVGVPFQELQAEIAAVDKKLRDNDTQQRMAHEREVKLGIEIGGARSTLANAEHDRAARLIDREDADAVLVNLARRGVFAAAGFADTLTEPGTPETAPDDFDEFGDPDEDQRASDALGGRTHTAVLQAARQLESALDVPYDDRSVEQAANRASQRRHELGLALDSLRLSDGTDAGVYLITAIRGNREVTLGELVDLLTDEVQETRALLTADEERLFSEFLTGQVRSEVVAKVRDSTALVAEMNRNLKRVHTASGIRVQLDWRPRTDEEEGTQRVLKLLLRNPEDLYDSEREQLLSFFRGRLAKVSTSHDGDTWSHRLSKLLDYRAWFTFTVQWAKAGGPLGKLTRREHAALSGGEKAVTLHLPLFAAAAAYYHAASVACPRLIVLDEIFAGVDDELRGQLFELIVNFDLDLLATSERETGTHSELDGVSVYQLVAYEGASWILALRSMWNGERLLRVFEEELIDYPDDDQHESANRDESLPMDT
jgi:uncharacterized protein (TIGR02680 family)